MSAIVLPVAVAVAWFAAGAAWIATHRDHSLSEEAARRRGARLGALFALAGVICAIAAAALLRG